MINKFAKIVYNSGRELVFSLSVYTLEDVIRTANLSHETYRVFTYVELA